MDTDLTLFIFPFGAGTKHMVNRLCLSSHRHALGRRQNYVNRTNANSRVLSFTEAKAEPGVPDVILEGDLLAYRQRSSASWYLGAVTYADASTRFHVRPVCTRGNEEGGIIECFVNWESDLTETIVSLPNYEVSLLDADYEERVVQDRLENPHGEVSEDCWKVSQTVLNRFSITLQSR